MRAALKEKIELIKHLYPKCQYPQNPKEWTIGHTCLQQIDEIMIPREKMFMPSWVDHLSLDWLHGKDCPPFKKFKQVYDALWSEMGYVKQCRDYWEHHPEERTWQNIRNSGLWNCEECSFVAHQWLSARQIPHQMIDLWVRNKETKEMYDAHCFVVFAKTNTDICRGLESTLKQLATCEDMYILDVWLGKCAPAKQLLNEYANLLKYQKNTEQPVAPIALAQDICFFMSDSIKRMDDWAKKSSCAPIELPPQPQYAMGFCAQANGARSFVPIHNNTARHNKIYAVQKAISQNSR